MIDGYTATYASLTYLSQTTSLSLSLQQPRIGDDAPDSDAVSDDNYGFSLGYTTTTTVATVSLLYVQESANSSETRDDDGGDQEKSALQTVLEGPKDPYNPLEDALKALRSADDDNDDDHSGNGRGNKFGHAIRDNTHGHNKYDVQAAYSAIQLDVSTSTFEYSVSV